MGQRSRAESVKTRVRLTFLVQGDPWGGHTNWGQNQEMRSTGNVASPCLFCFYSFPEVEFTLLKLLPVHLSSHDIFMHLQSYRSGHDDRTVRPGVSSCFRPPPICFLSLCLSLHFLKLRANAVSRVVTFRGGGPVSRAQHGCWRAHP